MNKELLKYNIYHVVTSSLLFGKCYTFYYSYKVPKQRALYNSSSIYKSQEFLIGKIQQELKLSWMEVIYTDLHFHGFDYFVIKWFKEFITDQISYPYEIKLTATSSMLDGNFELNGMLVHIEAKNMLDETLLEFRFKLSPIKEN